MIRLPHIILVATIVSMTAGCCLFRRYDAEPDPVEQVRTKRVPLQIANDVALRLSTVFFDENRNHVIYVESPTNAPLALRHVLIVLKAKLAGEPHIRLAPKRVAEYHLAVRATTIDDTCVAVFTVVRKGKILWTHSEELTEKGSK